LQLIDPVGPERSDIVAALQEKLHHTEERELRYIEKHRELQSDYQNLIDIAMELVQCLSASLTGQKARIEPIY
jgi:hypothetical protein